MEYRNQEADPKEERSMWAFLNNRSADTWKNYSNNKRRINDGWRKRMKENFRGIMIFEKVVDIIRNVHNRKNGGLMSGKM